MFQVKPIGKNLSKVKKYEAAVNAAINFAGNAEGEAWDALFLMGLAMSNLELLPLGLLIARKDYWKRAPASQAHPPTWESCLIIEVDSMHEAPPDDL